MSVINLQAFKDQLNDTAAANADDAELQATLDAAEAHVASLCGAFGGDASTLVAHATGDQLVLPATRLTGITQVRDPDGEVVELADGAVNLLSGIVRLPYRRRGAWAVDVTTGDQIPPDLKLATLIIAAHLWETQRVPGANRGSFGQQAPVPSGFAIPNRAATLLGPYRIPVIA